MLAMTWCAQNNWLFSLIFHADAAAVPAAHRHYNCHSRIDSLGCYQYSCNNKSVESGSSNEPGEWPDLNKDKCGKSSYFCLLDSLLKYIVEHLCHIYDFPELF